MNNQLNYPFQSGLTQQNIYELISKMQESLKKHYFSKILNGLFKIT